MSWKTPDNQIINLISHEQELHNHVTRSCEQGVNWKKKYRQKKEKTQRTGSVMESQVMCMSRDQSGDQTPEDRNMPSGNAMIRCHDMPRPGVNTINSLPINSTELSALSH